MALSYAQSVERIRKWSVKYNGGIDPIDFVESIEEVADLDDINVNLVPRMMPILLEDKALMWYRNNNKHWNLWSSFKMDFLKFFLSHRYFDRLEDEVRARVQKEHESFKDYVLEIKYLMRHTGMNQDSQLERIYRNMRTEYQMYIKRREFSSLTELTILADDFEELRAEQDKVSRGGVRQEVIVGRIEVEYPQTLLLKNTVRHVPTTPIQDKVISSSNSESPILIQQRSNQQQNQPKQVTTAKAKIVNPVTSTLPKLSMLTQTTQRRSYLEQHPVPLHGNSQEQALCKCRITPPQDPRPDRKITEVCNQQLDTQGQQMFQVQPCEPKQESQNIRPIRGNSQMQETQRQVNPKLTKKNPEVFKPARVTPDQKIFQSQTKQVSVHQTLQRVTSIKENRKSFNQDQVTKVKRPNQFQIQACKAEQNSRPIKQNPKVSIQQQVTPNREIVPVEIQKLQSQIKPRLIEENLQRINATKNHHITQVQIQDTKGHVKPQKVQDIETQQGQQKVTVSENHNKRVRLTQETPSPTQSLQQVSIKHDSQRKQESQEGKDDSTSPKDKIDNPLIQVQEISLGIPKLFSTQKLQKPMNNLGVLQQKDYDLVSIHQDKFFKIFKSPKKRHRNHAGR